MIAPRGAPAFHRTGQTNWLLVLMVLLSVGIWAAAGTFAVSVLA